MTNTDQGSRLTPRPALERPEIVQTGLARQSLAIVRRNLTHIKRMPEMLLDVTIQPVMFVLLFAFVFGSSIEVDTEGGYKAWLLAGIMAQTIAFASFIVAVGLTADLEKGIVDRMRSLPINPAAVLVGRSISSLMHSSIGLVIMSVTGLFIGWRIHTNVAEAALGYVLLLGWGFAMIWIGIWVGSAMRSVEAVNGVMFATMFPITFLANTFGPTDNMPSWLRTVAEWNPISSLTQAVRELWGNDTPLPADAALPLQHPVAFTIGWIVLITVVVAPLAIRTFNRRTAD
ncbi:ABC transporter permease [Nocardioides sp. zg-1308]|uniref:Transport permease protein n=1 Tax=Nocardioides renjunii TaxID=3095075 RepID=A0ABU5KEY9_9ACTN|nr:MULTISPECIES: ABC transporter permease [unclassified Nocardioides]MDZ5663543.1 ABC transporter permease [Nocardioides sp. S-58]NPD07027.1 ABC transporter permease [Nocardioides sp. zg-1308]WQQ20628.1 ABC transporter permease [Nocardioides sp. S-34]